MSLYGRLVRVRTDLTAKEKEESPSLNESMEKFQGRIGIVCTKCTASPGIFFRDGDDAHLRRRFWWNHKWFRVLDDKDIAVLDAHWLAELRGAFAKEFPDRAAAAAAVVAKPQRTFAIGDSVRVRADISDAEKDVGLHFSSGMNELIGKSGTIHEIDQDDGHVRISFSHVGIGMWWYWHPSWIEHDDGTKATKKRSVAALKDVETDLAKIVSAVEQMKKKIKS